MTKTPVAVRNPCIASSWPHFLVELWRNKVAVRKLLSSENFVFVRDYLPGHFYSPIPDLDEVEHNAGESFDRSRKTIEAIDLCETRQLELISAFAKTYPEMPFSEKQTAETRYYLDNPFFSFGDGVILYCLLRHFKPRRVVEVGSGFSSAEMLDVSDRFFDKPIEFTFIEPSPDRLYGVLSPEDRAHCNIETKPVQQVDPAAFRGLEEDDFLFIDSSHVGKICSDVLHILFRLLPLLKKGVIIHFHDIVWPFEYPQNWILEGRAWNEAYFLRAFLQYNPAFEVVFFNSFMAMHHSEALRRSLPLALKAPLRPETIGNSSLWIRKIV